MPNKWMFIAIIVVTGCITFGGLLIYERFAGGTKERLAQANAQIKHDKKVRNTDAKIAKSVPVSGDNVDQFLLSHTGKQ